MEQQKKNKIIFILLGAVICILFLFAIVQTFILKGKQNNLEALKGDASQIEQEYNQAKEKHDNIFKSDVTDTDISADDLTDEYLDGYLKHEGKDENGNPYGEEGEKVIEVK
jgi:biopolymer transport protein ExbB/TolQ